MAILIFPMHSDDTAQVAKVHQECFPRQHDSQTWISCNFSAFPRIMMYVARDERDDVIGYIQWILKNGFRQEAVVELEQIAVAKRAQGHGIAQQLIRESLKSLKTRLADQGSSLKSILVSTRTDNEAQNLYRKSLGAEAVATVKGLYSGDEVFMLANNL